MIRRLAAALLLVGCLPPLTNPTCDKDEDCAKFAGGWCHCIDGLCFKFDCPAPPEDTADPDAAPSDAPGAAPPCPPEAAAAAGDGCCPAGLFDRGLDDDCVLASSTVTLGAAVLAPASDAAGRVAIVHGDSEGAALTVLGPDLARIGAAALQGALTPARAPVVLAGV